MAFPLSTGYKDINPTKHNMSEFGAFPLYRRRSYKTEVMNLEVDDTHGLDEDDSEEHLILVIHEYKRRIASFFIADKESELIYTLFESFKRGLCIEEELLATQRLNNNAKSAHFKK